jgi:hypothetical protein
MQKKEMIEEKSLIEPLKNNKSIMQQTDQEVD